MKELFPGKGGVTICFCLDLARRATSLSLYMYFPQVNSSVEDQQSNSVRKELRAAKKFALVIGLFAFSWVRNENGNRHQFFQLKHIYVYGSFYNFAAGASGDSERYLAVDRIRKSSRSDCVCLVESPEQCPQPAVVRVRQFGAEASDTESHSVQRKPSGRRSYCNQHTKFPSVEMIVLWPVHVYIIMFTSFYLLCACVLML